MAHDVSTDASRARAVIIRGDGGGVLFCDEIESIQTEKNDSGDAGTFTITMPLAENFKAAIYAYPMDLVAIYAGRISTGIDGATGLGTNSPKFPAIGPRNPSGLTYGGGGARGNSSSLLASDTCLMLGMIDKVEEEQAYEGSPSATLTISGRDLTKCFLDNDVFVPYTVDGGGPQGGLANLSNVVIAKATSGVEMLKNVLNVFCKKDPQLIKRLEGETTATVVGDAALAQIATYGYPWDQFVDQSLLDDTYLNFPHGKLPNFSVQSGSVWANVQELRNFPIARLFVNEIGQLIFDDSYAAWFTKAPAGTIMPGEIRVPHFSQSDEDLVTSISIVPCILGMAQSSIAQIASIGRANQTKSSAVIQRFGYRFTEFQSQYDTAIDKQALAARFSVVQPLHNSLWRLTLTVKGNAKYRAGQRWKVNIGGANPATQLKTWYLLGVTHEWQFGADWTTTLSFRFPV